MTLCKHRVGAASKNENKEFGYIGNGAGVLIGDTVVGDDGVDLW